MSTLLHHARSNTVRRLAANKNESTKNFQPTHIILHFAKSRLKDNERLCHDLGLGYRHVALDYLERKNIYRKRSRILVDIQAEIVDYVQYQSGDILGSSTVE